MLNFKPVPGETSETLTNHFLLPKNNELKQHFVVIFVIQILEVYGEWVKTMYHSV
jgi:hypothetical protein